jgi:hypothetical protein
MPNPFIAQQFASVAPGQAAVCRIDGETFLGGSAPTPEPTRRLPIDATGLYFQHNDQTDTNSARSLSLNQAGWALVGWIAMTPSFVQSQQPVPKGDVLSAVFVANLDPKGPTTPPPQVGASSATASALFYKDVDGIENHDPSEVLDAEDPFSIETQRDIDSQEPIKVGWIAIDVIAQPGEGTWQELVPKLRVSIMLVRQDDHQNPAVVQTLVFDMFNPLPRPSERTIGAQEPTLKDYLVAQHRNLPPPSFFLTHQPSGQVWQAAIGMFAANGELETLVRGYLAVVEEPALKRMVVLRKLQDLLGLRIGLWQGRGALSGILNQKLVKVADRPLEITIEKPGWLMPFFRDHPITLSCVQWLSLIGGDELADVQQSGTDVAPGAVPSLQAAPKELRWLGGDIEIYHYDMVFSALNPVEILDLKRRIPTLPDSVLKQLPNVPTKSSHVGPLALVLGGFKVVISCSHAPPLLGGVPPPDDKFTILWRDKVFYGMFGEVSASIGSVPALPDKLRIVSGWKADPDDFSRAIFEIKVVTAKYNLLWLATLGDTTQLMTFNLADGICIEGKAGRGSVVPTSLSGGDPVSDLEKTVKECIKWRGKSAAKSVWDTLLDGTSLGASVGIGALMVGRPEVDRWVPPPRERTAEGGDGRTVGAFFQLDSADIATDLRGWSRRFLLESVLAVDLYLFGGTPGLSVIGHASPEGTPRHNLILSKLRAAAVKQAIVDTGIVDRDLVGADGKGDELATKGDGTPGEQLLHEPDPDGDTMKRDEFLKGPHKEENSRWPEFRKVVVEWWGHFFLTVQTVQGDDEDPTPPQGPPQQPGAQPTATDGNAPALT